MCARPSSNIFIDPHKNSRTTTTASRHHAALLMTDTPKNDFQFGARVDVEVGAAFDAGVLFLKIDETHWAKLCFEYSAHLKPMVVSVVNKGGTSDDANAFLVDGKQVKLRISHKHGVFAFHAANNDEAWTLVRIFAFDVDDEGLQIGFEAQSPNTDGCKVTFSAYTLTDVSLEDFRNGR